VGSNGKSTGPPEMETRWKVIHLEQLGDELYKLYTTYLQDKKTIKKKLSN
jgi:hypothetical protein